MLMFKPFLKYADFNGRARRLEYWLFQLFQILVFMGMLALIFSSVSTNTMTGGLGVFGFLIVFALGCLLPNLAVTVRRLHDTGRSAWWLLLCAPGAMGSFSNFGTFAALGQGDTHAITAAATQTTIFSLVGAVCNLIMFALMCIPGNRGSNRFGPNPKGGSEVSDIASVFDAPEPEEAPARKSRAYDDGEQPYKTVFDFGPTPAKPAQRDYT
ncbi:MAG: DUF805 domain-containing protein, partial [Asticcacaulis sp.]|nr:DUF805 domain-containing protein [Asticcacaulis sp.]